MQEKHYEADGIYDLAFRGRPDQIDAALKRLSAQRKTSDPLITLLLAMQRVLGGDAPGAMSVLQRMIDRVDQPARSYAVDILVPLLITSAKFDEAESILKQGTPCAPYLAPGFIALQGVLAACRGDADLSRSLTEEAIERLPDDNYGLMRARVLQRYSLAAYYRGDYIEGYERGLDAARLCESLQAFRNAAISYTVPCCVAHDFLGDPAMAWLYACRITTNARRAKDASWVNYGLVAQLDIVADTGNLQRLRKVRTQLSSKPLHEQYGERYSTVLADALAQGWTGRFETALTALGALRDSQQLSFSRRVLCDALIALYTATTSNIGETRRLVRRVLGQTAERSRCLPLSEAQLLRKARVVAAATCLIINDSTRGRRALSNHVDPTGTLTTFLTDRGIVEECVPAMMRGYARAINATANAVAANRPAGGLTPTELQVLRKLPDGTTLTAVAAELGKSRETVKKQASSIYAKLQVRNRTQAIHRARELHLLAK